MICAAVSDSWLHLFELSQEPPKIKLIRVVRTDFTCKSSSTILWNNSLSQRLHGPAIDRNWKTKLFGYMWCSQYNSSTALFKQAVGNDLSTLFTVKPSIEFLSRVKTFLHGIWCIYHMIQVCQREFSRDALHWKWYLGIQHCGHKYDPQLCWKQMPWSKLDYCLHLQLLIP